jgi:hypothetical protein
MGQGHLGKKQPQILADLGDGTYSGMVEKGRVLLINGNGRGNSLDRLNLGLIERFDKLTGIIGKRFKIFTLTFLEDRIVGQG